MQRLRQKVAAAGNSEEFQYRPGWSPADQTHHCLWHGVTCSPEQRVTRIGWRSDESVGSVKAAGDRPVAREQTAHATLAGLVPELAQLKVGGWEMFSPALPNPRQLGSLVRPLLALLPPLLPLH